MEDVDPQWSTASQDAEHATSVPNKMFLKSMLNCETAEGKARFIQRKKHKSFPFSCDKDFDWESFGVFPLADL